MLRRSELLDGDEVDGGLGLESSVFLDRVDEEIETVFRVSLGGEEGD